MMNERDTDWPDKLQPAVLQPIRSTKDLLVIPHSNSCLARLDQKYAKRHPLEMI